MPSPDSDTHENSATRLHRFIEKMIPQKENQQAWTVLLRASGVEPGTNPPLVQNSQISRILSLLFGEVHLLIQDLRSRKYSANSYSHIVAIFENHLTPGGLVTSWSQSRAAFAAALPVLLVFAESLPSQEEPIPAEILDKVKKEVAGFRKQVEDSELPSILERFIDEQLAIINEAARDYAIKGATAFKYAVRNGAFHEAENSSTIKQYQDSPELQRLRELQHEVVVASQVAIKIPKKLGAWGWGLVSEPPSIQSAATNGEKQ